MKHSLTRLLHTLSVGLLLSSLVAGVLAQPSVMLSTEIVHYPGEDQFEVTNVGTDTLMLSFPSTENLGGYEENYGTIVGYGWFLDAQTPDSLYMEIYLPYDHLGPHPTIPLAPDATAQFEFLGIDPCPVCRPGGLPSDSLYLRVADPSGADTFRVVLDLSGYVSTETVAESSSLTAEVYPNPARDVVFLKLNAPVPSDFALTVFDVNGRAVLTVSARSDVPVPLDVRQLPQGSYFARAALPDGRVLSQHFTVLR